MATTANKEELKHKSLSCNTAIVVYNGVDCWMWEKSNLVSDCLSGKLI